MNNAKKLSKTKEWERPLKKKNKTGDIKGIFHARMGTIKDRNGKDLIEAKEIKKRWQEYTENYTTKVLMTCITMIVCDRSSTVRHSGV